MSARDSIHTCNGMVVNVSCAYEEACAEARKWIEEATEITFPCEDFRESLKDGTLLCKLIEKLSGINIGQLNPIPRSLAWMDNLVIFLNICRYMGLKKSQLFRVDDLASVRNHVVAVKVKQKEEDRRLRNVLITIFWLGRLAYSLEEYQGPLPQLDAFETLINKNRPPEMTDKQHNKFELDTLSGSGTWPKVNRSSRSENSNVKKGSLEYFEHMRRQLIPRLTTNVKEKAVMYERRQQESSKDRRHIEERPRSFSNSKSTNNQPTGKATRRTYSFGVLSTNRNNESTARLYTGSITRRTPVKVDQSHIPKEPAKHYSPKPVKINRTDGSFQYDAMALKDKIPSSHSTVGTHSKNRRDSDYVSVKALIKQWSGSSAKKKIQTETIHHDKLKNRRSLPASFEKGDILSDTRNLPHSKSFEENMHFKSHKDYFSMSNRSLNNRLPSEVNSGLSYAEQSYVDENRTNGRRKSEPSNYSSREYDPWFTEGNRPSSKKKEQDSKNRYFKDREREPVIKKSENTDKTYAAISYPQQQMRKEKVKENLKHHVTNRRSFPLAEKAEVKLVENYMDQKKYEPKNGALVNRHNLESIGKYATMPVRRSKMNHDQFTVEKSQNDEKRISSDVNWDRKNWKTDEKYGKPSESVHLQVISSSQRSSSSPNRRLPTYEEAIVPLQETDLVDATKLCQTTEILEKLSVAPLQNEQLKHKEKRHIVTVKGHDYSTQKQPVNENVSKKNFTNVHAAEDVYPVLTVKDTPRSGEMISKRRHSKEKYKDTAAVKQTVTFTTQSKEMSKFGGKKSSGEKTSYQSESYSGINDVNNNKLPVYDEEALKTLFTSQHRSIKHDSNRQSFEKDRGSKEKDSLVIKDKTSRNEAISNEYERLREEQKTLLDEDFKDRGKIRVNPNVAQQFTSEGGVNFSNVVHEGELLELVAAEEKYWKNKVERKEKSGKQKELKKMENTNEKQERVNEMLREFKMHDQKEKIDYSEITDTLRAEEEFLAQEAEKLLKQRFEEKSSLTTKESQFDVKQQSNDITKRRSSGQETSTENSGLHSILKTSTRQKKTPSVTSSDDINLKPEADQAYHHHHPRRIFRSRSPVYICSGCRLPVERDICLYVAELQSYWHEKCFRCSVCHSNLIQNDQTPRIRVMFSRIHCENCLSNKKTGGQSTMV